MGAVRVVIDTPPDGRVAVRDEVLAFAAHVHPEDVPAAPLHVRWYSSLPAGPDPVPSPGDPPDLDTIALNPAGTTWSFSRLLRVGSQAITVAVKDQPKDDEPALRKVLVAGVAGGAPPPPPPAGTPPPAEPPPPPCVIHMLVARSVVPPHPPAGPPQRVPITRADGVWAEAPHLWPEPSYQAINRLAYSWRFPTSGGSIALAPATFEAADATRPARLGLKPLPATLPPGPYDATLTVTLTPAAPPGGPAPPADVVTLLVQLVD